MEYVLVLLGDIEVFLKVLIFDFIYDSYWGVVLNICVIDGVVCFGDKI